MSKSNSDSFKNFAAKFFIWINEHPEFQKFSFNIGDPTYHYTFRIWNDKREIDLHRTNENLTKGDPNYYQTLFRISFFSLGRIIVFLKQFDADSFVKTMFKNKINSGKLKRYNCVLIPLDSKNTDYEKIYISKKKKDKNRIKLNKEFDFSNFVIPITPEEGLSHPVCCFMVLKYKRGRWLMNGSVYRFPNTNIHGKRSFVFFSPSLHKELKKSYKLLLLNILDKIEFYNKENVVAFLKEKYSFL